MTEKVTIEYHENLPMPLIYLSSIRDLARWQVDQLKWAYEQGYRELTLSFFDTAPMGFDIARAASVVITAVMDFLRDHPDIAHLTILCGDTEPQPLITALSQYEKSAEAQNISHNIKQGDNL